MISHPRIASRIQRLCRHALGALRQAQGERGKQLNLQSGKSRSW
jgi:hypothetical protein